jgi:hypothetical protein
VAAWDGLRHRRLRPVLLHVALAGAVGVAIAADPTGYTLSERAEATILRAQIAARNGDMRSAEDAYLAALSLIRKAASSQQSNVSGRLDLATLNRRVRRGYAAMLTAQGRLAEARLIASGVSGP